jgi:hypothetical protein
MLLTDEFGPIRVARKHRSLRQRANQLYVAASRGVDGGDPAHTEVCHAKVVGLNFRDVIRSDHTNEAGALLPKLRTKVALRARKRTAPWLRNPPRSLR